MIHITEYERRAAEAGEYLRNLGMGPADVVVQCGSGLAGIAEELLPGARRTELSQIPHMPETTVAGHGNEAVFGILHKTAVLILTGRFHLFEGHDPAVAGFPAALASALQARLFICTNAAGSLNKEMTPPAVMVHADFINHQGTNALAGLEFPEAGQRFLNPNPAYDPRAAEALSRCLAQAGLTVHRGIYIAVHGPIFETLAELAMLRSWGADAVGMSTVPEVTACHLCGLPVVGLSVLTNDCFNPQQTNHAEVLAVSRQAVPGIARALNSLSEGGV